MKMLVAILFLLFFITGIIIFIPPFHWLIILTVIFSLSTIAYFILKLANVSKKYSYLGAFTVFILSSLLALKLFDPVNVVLAGSLFVGLIMLLK